MAEGGSGFVHPLRPVTLDECIRGMQRMLWIEEPFIGQPPDGSRSGSCSYYELFAGGGTSDVGSGSIVVPDGSTGVAELTLPVQLIPAAPDSGAFRLLGGVDLIIRGDDLVGKAGFVWRVQNNNPPQLGSDYIVYCGLVDPRADEAESSDGFYVYADPTSANWILRHRRAGVTMSADTGLVVATDAWQTLAVVADVGSGIVTMLGADDGEPLSPRVQITPVNIQPSLAITSMAAMHNPGNVTLAARLLCDYIGFGVEYGTDLFR